LARNLRRRLALVGQANSRCISTAPRRFLPVSFPEPDTPDGLYWESNATAVYPPEQHAAHAGWADFAVFCCCLAIRVPGNCEISRTFL